MRRDDVGVLAESQLAQASVPWDREWSAQGIVAALEPLVNETRKARIRRVIDARISSVTLLLDDPDDPHNGAAVLRSCEAFGIQQLHVHTARPFLVSHRVAQGTERWIDVITHPNAAEAAAALRRLEYTLVATHPEGDLLPDDLTRIGRVAIILGNERDGVGPELRAASSCCVRIPMRGFVESLNLSVSAALLLQAATRGRSGDLDPSRQLEVYARGLYHSVARAHDVLGALRPS